MNSYVFHEVTVIFERFFSNFVLVFWLYRNLKALRLVFLNDCGLIEKGKATPFTVLCNNKQFSRFEAMELATALSYCGSSSLTEKKDGLKALFTIISSDRPINSLDLKKIVERLNPLIGEGAHKVSAASPFRLL